MTPPPANDDFDEERIRVREALLEHANEALVRVVKERARFIPMKDIAAFVEGDETHARQVIVARRSFIAQKLRARASSGSREARELADLLENAKPEGGFVPCVFFTRVNDHTVDVSVVMLRNEGVS